ncbi:uncharacterized protein ABDE67_005593 [Symphorus nematophorus]
MRRKAAAKKASPRGAQGSANNNIKARENTHLKVVKRIGRPTTTPTGKGLGKAGAKRLGRLLKRAIQQQVEATAKGKAALPKTPVRLFKHQIQTEADNAPKTNTAKAASPHVSHLILSVVSQCKNRGHLSMAELKQTLAAAGYNVTKNSRQLNLVPKRPVNNETFRITRSASHRLNNKNQKETKQVRIINVKPPKPKADLKQSNTASKSPKDAAKSQRPTRKAPKPKGKSKAKTRKAAAKSHKPVSKTRKAAAKSHKPVSKTRKAAARTQKPKKTTPKARRKSPKLTGKKRRPATNRAAQARKAPRKAQRAQRHRRMHSRHPYKSTRTSQPPRRRLPNTGSRLNTQQRRVARRKSYYY